MADDTTITGYDYIDVTGLIIPATDAVQSEVEQEYRNAFGQDLIVTNDTKQGVLITTEVIARSNFGKTNGDVANQINPDEAGGVFQDAIAALFGLERPSATFSTTPAVLLTGRPNTIIPASTRGRDENGLLWASVNDVQLALVGSTGQATVDFQCTVSGPVSLTVGSLNQVVDDVLGWEGITNPSDNSANPGTSDMDDEDFRDLRRVTLARQGRSITEAIISDLYQIQGVNSLQFLENIQDTAQVINTINMVPHSVWVCVDGGADADIAQSLLNTKTAGAAWNGATTVNVLDQWSGQSYPVQFDRPTEVDILVRVSYRVLVKTAVDPSVAIPDAVVKYATGQMPGQRGFVVGGGVSPFEIAAAINFFYPTIYSAKVEMAVTASSPVWGTTEIPIAVNQVPRTQAGSVTVIAL